MMVMIVIAVLLLVAMFVLSFATSSTIGRCLRAARLQVGIWWNNHAPNAPTWQQVWAAIRPAIWIISILIGLMLVAWIPLFVLVVTICTAMGSFWSGIFLGFLVIFTALMYIIKKIPGFRALGTISYYIILVLLVASSFNFVFGWWSPGVKTSWGRLSGNWKQSVASAMDKQSLQSEAEAGTYARLSEDTVAILKKTGASYEVKKGDLVMVPKLQGAKPDELSEGMVLVLFRNEHKSFGRGSVSGFVPNRLLDFNYKQAKAEEQKSSKAKEEGSPMSKVTKISGEETWVVTYVSEENPGWMRVSLPPGKYTVYLNGNQNGTVWGKIDNEKFVVNNEMERWVSPQSSLEVKVEGGEGEKRIGIRRIG